ncbi:MAG: ribbon-helix-helix domain-containing protein [Microcystaceae cyanobacterium]
MTFSLTQDLKDRLDATSDRTGIPSATLIRRVIEVMIDRYKSDEPNE